MECSASDSVSSEEPFPKVIELNVGGKLFSTCLSTLRKDENSMLAAMFSGRLPMLKDPNGRYFIDRDGEVFGQVLDFLRCRKFPKDCDAAKVMDEADYYQIEELKNWCKSRPAVLARLIEEESRSACEGYTELRDGILEAAGEMTRLAMSGKVTLDRTKCFMQHLVKPGSRALVAMVSICYIPIGETHCSREKPASSRANVRRTSSGSNSRAFRGAVPQRVSDMKPKAIGDLQVDHDMKFDNSAHRPNLLLSSSFRGDPLHIMFSLIERELAESGLQVLAPYEAPWSPNGIKGLTHARCTQCDREMLVDWVRVQWWGSSLAQKTSSSS